MCDEILYTQCIQIKDRPHIIPSLFLLEDKVVFKTSVPDICIQLDRPLYFIRARYVNWLQYLRRDIATKWGLKTFSKNSSTIMRSDLDILHQLVVEKKSFMDCIQYYFGNNYILGMDRSEELEKEIESGERIRHERSLDIWGNVPWTKINPDKNHLNLEGEYTATQENLNSIESVLFGRPVTLMELCKFTEQSMSEITPDIRGMQVLYSV